MKTNQKPRFKNQRTAEARVKLLEKQISVYEGICDRMKKQLLSLAKLSATNSVLFSTFEESWAAVALRNQILSKNGMNPDGSPKKTRQQ